MIYLLFILLIVMLILSYVFSGRDFFAPATVQILTFAGSVFMCIYFMWSLDCLYDFHWETIGMVAAAMVISLVIGIIIHQLFSKKEISEHTPESVSISPISKVMNLAVMGFTFLTVAWLLLEIRRIGGVSGDFFTTMNRFHAINSYSTREEGRLPWALNQMISVVRVLVLLYGFHLIRFYDVLSFVQKGINIFIIGFCLFALLLTGGRAGAVNQLIGCFMIFHLLRIQKDGKYKPYRLKILLRITLILVLVMVAFFLTKNLVGRASRNETMNPVDYISYYTGSQYICLDQYLQKPPSRSIIFGKETFYMLNSFLIKYKLVEYPPYIVHLEFRPVGAGYRNNVYTFLRSYHFDFGMTGTFIFHSGSIIFLSVFYEYAKKKHGNLGILIFGQMYYVIVMSFFAERFYLSVFSVNHIKMMVMLVALYELLIRKRIRFVHRRSAVGLQETPGHGKVIAPLTNSVRKC